MGLCGNPYVRSFRYVCRLWCDLEYGLVLKDSRTHAFSALKRSIWLLTEFLGRFALELGGRT